MIAFLIKLLFQYLKEINMGFKKNISLVGYTGFVGSNIFASGKIDFGYNSKNITDAFGTNPDVLIYAGLRAEKFLANAAPEKDFALIKQAEENIKQINPKHLVLISTIDVLKNPSGKDETSEIETEGLLPYGLNRFRLEQWARENYPDCLIVRLPGLYGINLKKNFIYDFMNIVPSMLKAPKFEELSAKEPELLKYYSLQDNGFYKLGQVSETDREELKERFQKLDFTALNFTDSRNVYQFYPLSRLFDDIQLALGNGIKLLHPATEPVSASELYTFLTEKSFCNEISSSPCFYDFRTKYAEFFGGRNGYIMKKEEVLEDIKKFVGVK